MAGADNHGMNANRAVRVLPVVLAIAVAWPSLRAQQAESRHVVIVSIDGLQPSAYTTPGPSKAPALRRLAQSGAFAEGVIGVTPTVTYPSHTTIVTGVLPAVHGIYNNRIFDPENTSNGSWYWYARDIKVPTLAGILKTRGMKTAAVSWPATVGADIDYLVPEFGGVAALSVRGSDAPTKGKECARSSSASWLLPRSPPRSSP